MSNTEAAKSYEDTDFFLDETLWDDPYPFYEFLRETRGPVFLDPRYNMAVVVGHDEEVVVLKDHATYSSVNAPTGPFPGLTAPVEGDDADPVIDAHRAEFPMSEYMTTMDPPHHDEYRGLMWRLFTPRQMKKNEDYMWGLADEFLDRFVERGSAEIGRELATPFTALVIADLLGVPQDDLPRFRAWFDEQGGGYGEGTSVEGDPLTFLQENFVRYIEDRRREPRDDVLTQLAEATFSDGSLPTPADLAREASFIFIAGQETTVRLIVFAMRHLAEHPDDQATLRANRELIPNFLEEMLRVEAPVKVHFRLARKTTELGGVTIPAGTTMALFNGAANRDPRRFDRPAEVVIDRANSREQLAFSRGAHSCLGQSLARAESHVALERVLDRMGDIRTSEEHHGPAGARRWDYMPTWLFRGLNDLHLEFTPIT